MIGPHTSKVELASLVKEHLDGMGTDAERTALSCKFTEALIAAGVPHLGKDSFPVEITLNEALLLSNAMALACAMCQAEGRP